MRTVCCVIAVVIWAGIATPATAGIEAPESAPKDYSRNSVTGEYLPDWAAALLARSEALKRRSQPEPAPAATADAGFSWRDAGIGAGLGFMLAGAVVLVTRRPTPRLAPRA
jgi:hypothetical protein